MKCIKRVMPLTFILLLLSLTAYALPAFPGAEGMGASSVGGRGGTVYLVTNLNDSGTGSFRAAVEATGKRIVIFRVSGHIRLATTLFVTHPYITIAGQTSPGGIDVSGGMFCVSTHDVVVTHMRFRMGSDVCDGIASGVGNCETYGDSVRVMGTASSGDNEAYNVVFDHCSMSWGNDETLDIGGYLGNTRDVTISWCMIAQGLDDPAPESNHAYGIGIGSHYQASGLINVSLHHNYIAHFRYRVPLVAYNGFCDARNNVLYNWAPRQSMEVADVSGYTGTKANFISNYMKNGPLGSGATCGSGCSGIFYCGTADGSCDARSSDARGQIHASGNAGCAGDAVWSGWGSTQGWVSSGFLASSPHATTGIPVTTTIMNTGYAQTVLGGCGATKPSRDSVDAGFVNDFNNGTGSVLADRHFPTGYPTFSTPANPTDADSDGMADSWEIATFGSTAQTAAGDYDGDGYTNIEEYLHYLGGYTATTATDTTRPLSPSGINIQLIN